jgi:hypothetical protein
MQKIYFKKRKINVEIFLFKPKFGICFWNFYCLKSHLDFDFILVAFKKIKLVRQVFKPCLPNLMQKSLLGCLLMAQHWKIEKKKKKKKKNDG